MFKVLVLGLAALCWQDAAGPLPTLTLEQAYAHARPGLAGARLEADLAGQEAELRTSHGLLREPAELSARLGYRNMPGGGTADAELKIELPLASAAGQASRRDLAEALAEGGALLREAASQDDRRQIVEAFLALWGAQQRLALRRDDQALLEVFAELLREQIAAGKVAAYQAELVAAELQAARGQHAEAAADAAAAWVELAALTDLPVAPAPLLARPAFPEVDPVDPPALVAGTLAAAALVAERRLADAAAQYRRDRELGRSSLAGSLAREGDDEVALLGWRWRLALPGRAAALDEELARGRTWRERDQQRRLAELASRRQRSQALLAALPAAPAESFAGQNAWQAVELRVREGKDSPADALAVRRTLITARLTTLELELRRLQAQAELSFLGQPATGQPALESEPRP